MDQCGPKYVELTYVMNKTPVIKKTLCILLDCIYIRLFLFRDFEIGSRAIF